MQVPIGERCGTMSWEEENGSLSGVLEIMGYQNPFTGRITSGDGFVSEKTVVLEGKMVTPVREIPYTAEGYVTGGRITLQLQEPRHTYFIEGTEDGHA